MTELHEQTSIEKIVDSLKRKISRNKEAGEGPAPAAQEEGLNEATGPTSTNPQQSESRVTRGPSGTGAS